MLGLVFTIINTMVAATIGTMHAIATPIRWRKRVAAQAQEVTIAMWTPPCAIERSDV